MKRWLLVMGLVVATLGGVVTAHADYEDGQRAWDAGRHSEALREWQASANNGDAKAMLALGRLYMQGLGAPQDYVKAHLWFNLAASRGEAEAVTERDALAGRMAPEQVAKAQEQAAAWRPGETQPAKTPAASGSAGLPPPKFIREAQELLAALGYEPDPPDGQWSARTAQAYQAFVRDANLPMTDTLTPAALKAMRARVRQVGAVSTPTPKAELPPDALHRAAKAGNLNGLEAALAAGAAVNMRDGKGWTALMYVVDKGYVLLVEPLLQAKADLAVRAPDGATALFMAVAHGHLEIIEPLMKAGADPTIKGPKGKTATELAQARYGDLQKALKKGEPPAIIALLAGRTLGEGVDPAELVRTLLKRKPGEIFRDCEQCPEMVVVPAGRFQMGDLNGDGESDEQPVHEVTIDHPFAVSRYEVTKGEFAHFVKATDYDTGNTCEVFEMEESWWGGSTSVWKKRSGFGWRTPGYTQTDGHPVVCVNWTDARAYMRWLSRETGKRYRLLSEGEWEYAARAGTRTAWYWGESESKQCQYANGADDPSANRQSIEWTDNDLECDDGVLHTSSVGAYKANGFGLYDMLGNVAEWVEDCWNASYTSAPTDGSAWTSGDCSKRMLRSGAWAYDSRNIRSAFRTADDAGIRHSALGFRVARTLD